eukprot:scaffold173620_cov40-Attheya_sp.AAC.1
MMMGSVGGDASEKDVSHDVLNLRRLLYCMTSSSSSSEEDNVDLSLHHLMGRVELARRMWADLEPHLLLVDNNNNNNNNNEDGIHATLRMELEQACQHAQSQIQQLQSDPSANNRNTPNANNANTNRSDDLVQDIFFSHEQEEEEEESFQDEQEEDHECSWSDNEDEDDDEEESQVIEHEQNPTTNNKNTNNTSTAEELQQRQAEQLEEEISEMAEQLKHNTMHMNQTIRTQTNDLLDGMEQVAQDNLDSVTQTAKDVDAHVQKGWSKAIATWTLLFTILATFIFCFMTLRVAPKRPNACLFFCPKTNNIQNTPPLSSSQQQILPETTDTIANTAASCHDKDDTCESPVQEEETLDKEEVEPNTTPDQQRRQEATSPDSETTTCEATDANGACLANLDEPEVEEEVEEE